MGNPSGFNRHDWLARWGVLLVAAACTAATDAAFAAAPEVFAYYYAWYEGGDWSRHAYPNTPELGEYDSGSAEVARRHIEMAADHGLDGFVVSWWGDQDAHTKRIRTGLLSAPNLGRVRFAMLYESAKLSRLDSQRDLWFDFSSPRLVEQFTQDLRQLKAEYFHYPNYWRIDGRPVVVFYLSRNYENFSAEKLREIQDAAGVELYTVGDEVFLDRQELPERAMNGPGVFDAYTAYNLLQNHRVEPQDDAVSYHERIASALYRRWAEEAVVFPGVFPSYKDFRGNRVLAGDPARFEQLMRSAGEWADANAPGTPRAVLVASFNEWWEGSTIEPAKEYGAGYLEAIQRFKNAARSAPDARPHR